MLEEFITSNRDVIIDRTRVQVAMRRSPKPSEAELENGIPVFLEQLVKALHRAKQSQVVDHTEIKKSARQHGSDLLRLGLSVSQVVHAYGDVCQVVTALALEQDSPIAGDDFKTLNVCLDDAIAEAATEFAGERDLDSAAIGTERLGVFAHELRNLINVAVLSFHAIKSGQVSPGGSTGLVLDRTLIALSNLVDLSLADVRLDAGVDAHETISVRKFVEEVELGAVALADARGVGFHATSVDPALSVRGDRQVLAAAVSNLLQNAFKFTPKGGSVTLSTRASKERVLFEVEDGCGGLPPGKAEELFKPFQQRGADRTGMGLGLSISLKAAKANGGEVRVRDLPGKGCVFTLDLPLADSVAHPRMEERSPAAIH